jgi:ubiquinone/menaquinone biosynthesis C-methylase UbiE
MAGAGAHMTLVDISQKQLELNELRLGATDLEPMIRGRYQLDVVDLSKFADNTFDISIAYGGPISYVFDKGAKAISELLRVTKPGGYVLFSVMSKWGSTRKMLPPIMRLIDHYGIETIGDILHSGNVNYQLRSEHRFHMYDSMELVQMLAELDCELVHLSASGVLAIQNDVELEGRWEDPTFWPKFLEWELEASRQPGALDFGTHIIAVLRKSAA